MKVSSGWIKNWLRRTMLSDGEVVEALERAGIEIEQVTYSTNIDKRVVVALVNKVVQHPGADRLKLVEVGTGESIFNIVCGAPNVRKGLKVALAQIGTTLPDGDKIEKAKLRGEVSEGMLCSEFELKLGNDHNGIMELSNDLAVGTPLCEIFPEDAIIDVKTPANRWDVQSVYGLAREVSAMTNETLLPLSPPPVDFSYGVSALDDDIEAPRYTLTRIRLGEAAPSPSEVKARLRAAGMRPLSTVVDITNYVMLETGQPLHAFDADKVHLPLGVRPARKGETLVTLDGAERKLHESDLVIADKTGPIALAGVMGGKATEVSDDTKEILLESAVFESVRVRKTAQRHGLRTEASARMERGLPTALPPLGAARAAELLKELAGAEVLEAYEAAFEAPEPWNIALAISHLNTILGFGVSHKEAVAALGKLGIEAGGSGDEIVVPAVPWWRPDLKEAEDLVEEIVRVLGYDKVPATIPAWRPKAIRFDRMRAVRRRLRDVIWAAGAFEVMTYSFVSQAQLEDLGLDPKQHEKLKNPLSSEQAYLRSNLLASHLATLERNRMYAKAMRFYEISNVFLKRSRGEQPDEPLRLGVTVLEPEKAYGAAKGILDALADELNVHVTVRPAPHEHYAPGRAGDVYLGGKNIGVIGQLHPARVLALKLEGEVAYFELDLTPLMEASGAREYKPASTFPETRRDVAVLVPATITWEDVRAATDKWDVEFVSDYYGKEIPAGKKSLTIRLTLSLPDRTPTEAEAAELEAAVVARLSHKLGAQKRG